MKVKDITGNKYGRLTVICQCGNRRSQVNGKTVTMWKCICDCGKTVVVPKYALTSGSTRSCGCLKADNNRNTWTTHGMSKTRLYRIWRSMKDRCYNKSSPAYQYYGGKGIKMCDEWIGSNGFQDFHRWAIQNGYEEPLTIERISVDGDYSPENCMWIPRNKQTRNRSCTNWVSYNGEKYTLTEASKLFDFDRATLRKHIAECDDDSERAIKELIEDRKLHPRNHMPPITINGETKTLGEWCKKLNVPYARAEIRIKRYGWTPEEALLTPKYGKKKSVSDEPLTVRSE